jgi:hypothetical protein
VFMAFEKAFDRVSHTRIWSILCSERVHADRVIETAQKLCILTQKLLLIGMDIRN